MLSLRQAYEVRTSVIEYLKAAFSFKEKEEAEAFLRFIEGEETGLFKGLYLPLKLPFEKSDTAIFATHNSNIPVLEDGEQIFCYQYFDDKLQFTTGGNYTGRPISGNGVECRAV